MKSYTNPIDTDWGLRMNYCYISETSAKFNIPESTIRYYETQGLLPLLERDEAERRLFLENKMALFETVIC